MNKINILITAFVILISNGCSVIKNQNKGSVVPKDFDYTLEFQTMKSLLILPFKIDGETKNFIFDTGADYSLIQRDSLVGKKGKFAGASKRKMELGNEIIASLKIGDIDFKNTIALNGDLEGLKSKIPNFGGLIGQPVIKKANWLIDYPNKTLNISNKNFTATGFEGIPILKNQSAPYTYISINGVKHKVIIDLGSSSEFNLPEDSKLAKELIRDYNFTSNERERYTLGGMQTTKEQVGIIPVIKLGNLEFKNVNTSINVSSQPRIGIAFFKDCEIYIDNSNKTYKIKK